MQRMATPVAIDLAGRERNAVPGTNEALGAGGGTENRFVAVFVGSEPPVREGTLGGTRRRSVTPAV